jgi:hypothetical protein
MFASAIDAVAHFTRPIHFISRNFESQTIIPGAATLFFVNVDGWALTCGHVADQIAAMDALNNRYREYRRELDELRLRNRDARRKLEKKYGYNAKTTVQIKARFIGCGTGDFNIQVQRHGTYDVALLHFSFSGENAAKNLSAVPKFAANGDDLKQGRYLCRLGFPFPEFTNFSYSATTDDIDWSAEGQEHTPRFPIDGMVTRHLADPKGAVVGFDMSTPGLRGQSGGPCFDVDARIWGMQSMTRHLDLDFDVDQIVLRQGVKERRHDSAFLHVGNCVHVNVLKAFMREHGVKFNEA